MGALELGGFAVFDCINLAGAGSRSELVSGSSCTFLSFKGGVELAAWLGRLKRKHKYMYVYS